MAADGTKRSYRRDMLLAGVMVAVNVASWSTSFHMTRRTAGLSNGALMTTQAANAGGAPPPISSAATELDANKRPIFGRSLIAAIPRATAPLVEGDCQSIPRFGGV